MKAPTEMTKLLLVLKRAACCLGFVAILGAGDMSAQGVSVREGTVSVEGVELFYRDVGSGPPLLLLHGFTANGQVAWEPYFERLGASYRLIVPDIRGHGRSSNPSGEFTHRQAARDIFALLDHLGIDEFRGIGHSSGTHILLHMATSQPARSEALILAAGGHYLDDQARAVLDSVCTESLIGSRQVWHARGRPQMEALCDNLAAMATGVTDMNFTSPLLSTISAPTLILYGDRDTVFPVELALQQYRAIPDAYLWVIPGGGHGTAFESFGASSDLSAEFVRVALAFFADLRPPN